MGTTSCDFCGQYYAYNIYPSVHVTQDESSNTYERQYLPSVHRSGLYNECRLQTIDERYHSVLRLDATPKKKMDGKTLQIQKI